MTDSYTGKGSQGFVWSNGHSLAASFFIEERFAKLGLPIPRGNRLSKARATIIRSAREEIVGAHELAGLAAAHRALLEAFFILYAQPSFQEFSAARLRCLMEGAEVHLDSANSTPRDLQFELFIFALLTMCGVPRVTMEEPDIVIHGREHNFGIAVKRLSSLRKTQRRAKDALTQIRRADLRSAIMINFDRVVEDTSADGAEALVTREIASIRKWIATKHAEDVVFLIMGFASLPQWNHYPEFGLGGFRLFTALQWIADNVEEIGPTRQFLQLLRSNLGRSINSAIAALEPSVQQLVRRAY